MPSYIAWLVGPVGLVCGAQAGGVADGGLAG